MSAKRKKPNPSDPGAATGSASSLRPTAPTTPLTPPITPPRVSDGDGSQLTDAQMYERSLTELQQAASHLVRAFSFLPTAGILSDHALPFLIACLQSATEARLSIERRQRLAANALIFATAQSTAPSTSGAVTSGYLSFKTT